MTLYLDHHATTPLDKRVLEAMLPFFSEHFGNAASTNHSLGKRSHEAVKGAREQVAHLLKTDPLSIVFTSGATEANNLALKGLAEFYGDLKNHIITVETEHPAVLDCCDALTRRGFKITKLGVDGNGRLNLDELSQNIGPKTLAISVMFANNETGTIHDISAIGSLAKQAGVFFHCDGAQAAGKLPIDVEGLGIDLFSFSAHKFYGPKGMGGLYIRRKNPRVRLVSQIHGGGHERSYRSGTLNVPLIVGMGKACDIAGAEMAVEWTRLVSLRDRFLANLEQKGLPFKLNGSLGNRLPGNLNLRFPGIPAAALLKALPDIALSSGSACTTAIPSPSKTLLAMGLSAEQAAESIRIGLGRFNTAQDIDFAASRMAEAVNSLKIQPETNRSAVCSL